MIVGVQVSEGVPVVVGVWVTDCEGVGRGVVEGVSVEVGVADSVIVAVCVAVPV